MKELTKALNRHYKAINKKKEHPASKCKRAKCGVCSPHKSGGNSKMATKVKYRNLSTYEEI